MWLLWGIALYFIIGVIRSAKMFGKEIFAIKPWWFALYLFITATVFWLILFINERLEDEKFKPKGIDK